MKRKVPILVLVILAGFVALRWILPPKSDSAPEPVTRPTLDSIINVHGSPEQGLRICGRTFRRVRGAPPYYIGVPTTSLVILAYEQQPSVRVLVVCDTNDCSFREIPLGDSVFGDQIGYWTATKGQMGDTIESVSSNRIALLHKGFRYLERSVLDLEKNEISVVQVESELQPRTFDFLSSQAVSPPPDRSQTQAEP